MEERSERMIVSEVGGAIEHVPGGERDAFHSGMRSVPDGVRRAVRRFPFPLEPGRGQAIRHVLAAVPHTGG